MHKSAALVELCAGMLVLGSTIAVGGCSSRAAIPEAPRNAIVTHPQTDDADGVEIYSGDVHARYESRLGFRVAGKIKARHVDVGAHVQAGQVLAELDAQDLDLAVTSARATLTSAMANRDLASSEYNRYHALLEKHYISRTQVDTQMNALKAASAQVDEAKAALAVARNQAQYTTLRADHAGTITTIDAEAGQVVAAGQAIATLARDGAIEVEIAVPENRVADYRQGEAASIEAWAQAGKRIPGHLREIAPEADPVTRTYRVRVALDDDDSTLRLGQTARVYFTTDAHVAQTMVPLSALDRQGGKAAVWIVDQRTHQVHPQAVAVDAYRENGALLDSGVALNQWIVVAGVQKLRDGETIAPIDDLNRPVKM